MTKNEEYVDVEYTATAVESEEAADRAVIAYYIVSKVKTLIYGVILTVILTVTAIAAAVFMLLREKPITVINSDNEVVLGASVADMGPGWKARTEHLVYQKDDENLYVHHDLMGSGNFITLPRFD